MTDTDRLLARQAAEDLARHYVLTIDQRDFDAYRALFGDTVTVDYQPPLPGVENGELDTKEWVEGATETFNAIPATQHIVVPASVELAEDGASATVISNCQAAHFDPEAKGGDTAFTQFIRYTHHVQKDGSGWIIAKVEADILYSTGNPMILAGG